MKNMGRWLSGVIIDGKGARRRRIRVALTVNYRFVLRVFDGNRVRCARLRRCRRL